MHHPQNHTDSLARGRAALPTFSTRSTKKSRTSLLWVSFDAMLINARERFCKAGHKRIKGAVCFSTCISLPTCSNVVWAAIFQKPNCTLCWPKRK